MLYRVMLAALLTLCLGISGTADSAAAKLPGALILTPPENPPAAQAGGVSPVPPANVVILSPPPTAQAGQAVGFNAATALPQTPGAVIAGYAWTFGDGGTATGQGVSHIYSFPGSVTITLTVTDSTGGSGRTTTQLQVASNAPPPSPSTTVTYQPGWNMIAVPSGGTIPGPLTLYALPAGAASYQTVQNPQDGTGYWAYFNSPASASIPLNGPQTSMTTLYSGYWVMIGNPGSAPATVTGADVVYTYSAANGYQSATTLDPGQGAWAYAAVNSPVNISSR